MIVTALLNLIYTVLSALMVFNLPSLPDSVVTVANSVVEYVSQGIRIIQAFTGNTAIAVLAVLLQLVLLVHTAYFLFTIIRFVITKIPMLNIRM